MRLSVILRGYLMSKKIDDLIAAGEKVKCDDIYIELLSDRDNGFAGLCQVDTGQVCDDLYALVCELRVVEFFSLAADAREDIKAMHEKNKKLREALRAGIAAMEHAHNKWGDGLTFTAVGLMREALEE